MGAVLLFVSSAVPAAAPATGLVDILSSELQRNFEVLKAKGEPAPYFLSYEVTEVESRVVSATFGALQSDDHGHNRFLDVSVRVGTPQLDNYHRVRGDAGQFTSGMQVSLDNEPAAIKHSLWSETDRAYRAAAERLIKIQTNREVKVLDKDQSADFSREEGLASSEPSQQLTFDDAAWQARTRKLSALFSKHPAVLVSGVSVIAQNERRSLVSTEGARIEHGRGFARVIIFAQGKAADGMDLSTSSYYDSLETDGLPADSVLETTVENVALKLEALLKAPVAEPFVGPAIFSGRASGVFFHEIFGHRIEGHRQKDESEGQTFTASVGSKVLPDFLSVLFDPTRRKVGGIDLNGWYTFDDEGIAGKPVTAVENGVLKSFLMSRSPIAGFAQSNGHGRRQPGREIVSRQSNLIVESTRTESDAALRAQLIEEIKRQKKPYGLYFEDVSGGFTNTGRNNLQAFKVLPVVVYRVYADGRPDEMIRGADIVGTPLASFAKILATSDRAEVFNGYCGAESGSVPVSAVSPALLISEIEIEKKDKSQERPPLLPAPALPGDSE
jgi:TldD protein